MSFVAQYPDECGECGGDVKGHEARTGPERTIVHVDCPPEPTPAPVCPTCFITLPVTGICGGDCA